MRRTQEERCDRTHKRQPARMLFMSFACVVLGWNAALGLRALKEAVAVVRYQATEGTKVMHPSQTNRMVRTLGQYAQLDCIQQAVYRDVPPRTRVYVSTVDEYWYVRLSVMLYQRNPLVVEPIEADVEIGIDSARGDSECGGVRVRLLRTK